MVKKTHARLADGREIIYFDESDSAAPVMSDSHELPPFRLQPTVRYDVVQDEWVSLADFRQDRTCLPPDDQGPLCPSTATRATEIPAHSYDVVVFEIPLSELRTGCLSGPGAYVAGVVWAIRDAAHRVPGLDIVIDGAVPAGSGLSSSAALDCAAALAVAELSEIRISAAELARLTQRAESEFVGVPCGIMDQMASMLARAGHALFLDTRSGAVEHVPFDPAEAGLAAGD